MDSSEKVNWLYSFPLGSTSVPDGNFGIQDSRFLWPMKTLNAPANTSVEIDGSSKESNEQKDAGNKKRARTKSSASLSSKACKEKQRRDKLNEKFMELAALIELEKPPKTNKAEIVADAVQMVTQLKNEVLKLKDSSLSLQEKIREVKAEKQELHEQKLRLKAEKGKLQQQLVSMNIPRPVGFMPPPPTIPTAVFPLQSPSPVANNLVPVIGYPCPGITMWQFIPPAPVDPSQGRIFRSAVA